MVPRWFIPMMILAVLASCGPPEPIKIGFLAGMTGSVSELGVGARRALEMEVTAINKSGGLKGRPLLLVALDDGNEPAQALAACQRFEQERVVAVIGPMASTVIGAILPYLNEHKVLTVSPTVSAASVAGKKDWFFRVITLNRAFGQTLGHWVAEQKLAEISVLRETSNDAYTRPILDSFLQVLSSSGTVVRPAVEFDLRSRPDYEALAAQLGKASAYLVLANGYDSALIGQQLARRGRWEPLLAPPWAMTSDVISLGGRQAERMVFVSIYDSQSTNPGWLAFRSAYQALYGEDPGFAAVYARDALTLLLAALEKAPSFQADDLRTSLMSVGEVDGLQSPFRLDEYGDVVRGLSLETIREGRFVRNTPR